MIMKLMRIMIISFTVILSVTLLFVVDFAGLHPFSVLSELSGDYDPLIGRVNFLNYADLYMFAFKISPVLLIILVVLIRRTYNERLKRLIRVALPLLIALCIQFLLVNKIDAYIFAHRDFIGFIRMFFINLPAFLTGYMSVGIVLFILIMLTCYPVGILIDKLLLYITSKIPKHSQGSPPKRPIIGHDLGTFHDPKNTL